VEATAEGAGFYDQPRTREKDMTTATSPRWAGQRHKFTIRLTYFKPSGKYYTDAEFEWEGAACGDGPEPSCYMNDAVAHVRGTRDGGGQGSMPGLSEHGEGWDGFILVDCDRGFPALILPPKE
jgi:hypothetical protein